MLVRRPRTFENKIWRMIYGPVRDTRINEWKRMFNMELLEEPRIEPVISYIKEQKIQWLRHFMRRNKQKTIRAVLEWNPEWKML